MAQQAHSTSQLHQASYDYFIKKFYKINRFILKNAKSFLYFGLFL